MKVPTLKDARGNRSFTLFGVAVAFLALVARFIAPFFGDYPVVSVTDFGMAFVAIFGVWQAREYKQKDIENVNKTQDSS